MTGDQILDAIEVLFPNAQCELLHETPFQLLVAVVLSAQTTDASVNKVTPGLFAKWPDAKSLMHAPLPEVEDAIRTIGLYRTKARNIIALSQSLEDNFHGVVPSSYKELQSLPGVGRKTANVVRSVSFDIPAFAVDTHVERVSKRLGLAKVEDNPLKVEEKLKRKISRSRWNQGHHDMIFFGRYFCTAKKPRCSECPFQSFCQKDKLELYQQSLKEKKKMAQEKKLTPDQIAQATVEEARVFAQEADAIVDADRSFEQEAKNTADAARILVQAQNAADNATEEKPFTPPKDQAELFDEVNAFVQAASAMDDGYDKANKKELKHYDEYDQAREWNPEAVIDEKIKEEQTQSGEEALKDEIVDGLE